MIIIGIYNSPCHDLDSAIKDDGIVWISNNISSQSQLDYQLEYISNIICACYREDQMEYCIKNTDTGKIVCLIEYRNNKDYKLLMELLNDVTPTTKSYIVTIVRTEYQSMEFNVKATSESEAEEKAQELAWNTEFSRGDAKYNIEWVREV